MLGRYRNSYAEINLKALEHNFNHLKSMVNGAGIVPMVKANAYGHGEIQVSRVVERLGARYLGVALIEEGIALREAGVQTPILFFGFFDALGAEALIKYRLTPVLSSFDQIEKLKASLTESDHFPVHIEFNTGMQRNGFEVADAARLVDEFDLPAHLKLEGLCTHFISSEDFKSATGRSSQQIAEFQKIRALFKSRIQSPLVSHVSNSGGLLAGLTSGYEAFRPGLSLYGVGVGSDSAFQPVLTLKSQIAHVRKISPGATVSYGGLWRAGKESSIAVVPLGYADGFPRGLSQKASVLVNGVKCPIRGAVCMDYFMIDVTELDESRAATVGDEVILIGKQKGAAIFVEELAAHLGTISYEVLTGIQERVPRVYIH